MLEAITISIVFCAFGMYGFLESDKKRKRLLALAEEIKCAQQSLLVQANKTLADMLVRKIEIITMAVERDTRVLSCLVLTRTGALNMRYFELAKQIDTMHHELHIGVARAKDEICILKAELHRHNNPHL